MSTRGHQLTLHCDIDSPSAGHLLRLDSECLVGSTDGPETLLRHPQLCSVRDDVAISIIKGLFNTPAECSLSFVSMLLTRTTRKGGIIHYPYEENECPIAEPREKVANSVSIPGRIVLIQKTKDTLRGLPSSWC